MSRISHTEGGLPARGGDHGPCARSSGRGPRTKCIVGVSHPMVCGQVTGESRGHLAIDWMVREEQAEDRPGAKKKKNKDYRSQASFEKNHERGNGLVGNSIIMDKSLHFPGLDRTVSPVK